MTHSATSSAHMGWNDARPEPVIGIIGSHDIRPSRVMNGSLGEYTQDGANTVCAKEDSIRARSATALARINRDVLRVEAPRAEKNTKRSTPARSAARTSRQVATPASSSID